MKIGVFCSANDNIASAYFDAAKTLGKWMAAQGHVLVYGGSNCGLMECIGQAVHQNGGMTIGIIPDILEKGSRRSEALDVEIPCGSLSQRKDLLMAQSDVLVALPGGIGTLDEIFTVAAAHKIGYTAQRVILYNVDGFWNPLLALLDHLCEEGMLQRDFAEILSVADSMEDLIRKLE